MKLRARAVLFAALGLCCFLRGAADDPQSARHPDERDGDAQLIHRADVLKNRGAPGNEQHLWPLVSTPEARMSYFEVTSRSGMHFHPDADHRMYVLEGSVLVVTGARTNTAIQGDLIVIPRGVRHC
jgi:quercetin dioxygenase-like cupin family protein